MNLIGGFKGARDRCPPLEFGLNMFQERPFGASRMQENLLSVAPPQTPLGELAALP